MTRTVSEAGRRIAAAGLALLLFVPASRGAGAGGPPEGDQDAAASAILRRELGRLGEPGGLTVDGVEIASRLALPLLYEADAWRPFWTPPKLEALLRVVRDSAQDGLSPADYHLAALERLSPAAPSPDPQSRVNLDLIATDAFVLLLHHLYLGKVDPRSLDPHWNLEPRPIVEQNAVRFISEALTTGRLADAVEAVRPHHWWYAKARASLAEYRALAARGGWEPIPAGPALKAGMSDARVPALRRRLAATGDLAGQPLDSPVFDDAVAAAVRAFQTRHRLSADGAVGSGTLAELNVPVDARILQIRVNLERGRWVLHEIAPERVVLVDIAGFEASLQQDQKSIWSARIQVGKPYRQTPVFASKIDQVVFDPTWTVPPTILFKDILPELKRNPGYLASKKLEVLDRNGKPVDPATIDWARLTARNFPYTLRQGPGPDNALGRVKILFPNPHFVYLHDTPSKALFEKEDRAFSSGCIRVQHPLELVQLLLNDPKTWNAETIARTIEAGVPKTARVTPPVPVLLLYWTIVPSDDGHTVFKRDPYRRDPRLAAALDAPYAGELSVHSCQLSVPELRTVN
jgi:murein L,D-transpeptidase YcbB/YkuD